MKNKKALVAIALVALIGIVGGAYAYYTTTVTFNNEFTTGTYSTTMTEEFEAPDNWTPGTATTKKVNVTNSGSVDIAARVIYTETWTAANGTTTLDGYSNGEKIAQFAIGSDWVEATDGYYYYKYDILPERTSTDFISSVTFNPNFELEEGRDIVCTKTTVGNATTTNCESTDTGYAGAKYRLDITVETIQADAKWTYTAA